ncbi:poly(A) RNA polymerase, mitochondrial isoform X1 [Takifugu rubripes]|uniref:Mitochondrial poly(A) polymerase n=2 Tax=Takifugu rubripes TaxID=31033 RepID=H2S203_TAKRU|nr:poly(A) RNA polymerase, mitochondrial isoform X1 [Takifugu rubripes]|eukprot:XP_011616476.1 PREDICTED: poly(A) RNA polymerase, mitochondrial isoform X1 [Takifugu rubripes]
MATSCAFTKFHMRGTLLKNPQKVDRFLCRTVRTVASAKSEVFHAGGHRSLSALQEERFQQAERSVLIGYHSRINEQTFLKNLSRHGDIKKYFFYESYGVYALVEFTNRESVASLLDEAVIPTCNHEATVPFKSRLLSVKNLDSADHLNLQLNQQFQPQTSMPINQLIKRLAKEKTMEQQLISLTEAYQLTEENSRLRFLVCSLIRDLASTYFPECTIKPFGSSVNGFGKLGCDLDMILDIDGTSISKVKPKSGLSMEFQLKRVSSERVVTQSMLSVIGESLDRFAPGCVGIQKILNARCPLLRFAHQPSGFQCDLTANNRVAVKSTELLYLYGELDPRVRFLVFTVRCWARVHNITSNIPGAWITNFSLTVMVLFFLQKRNPPIIPTLDHLKKLAGPADRSVVEGNDCTFVRDFSKVLLQKNSNTLEDLLREFFDFYATFPFSNMSINIRTGKEQHKPEVAPLHIQNPFESSLNISKNVNNSQLDRFIALCQETSWLLQQSETMIPRAGDQGDNPTPWGLASLLLPSQVVAVKSRKKRREPASERIKSLLESLKNTKSTKN